MARVEQPIALEHARFTIGTRVYYPFLWNTKLSPIQCERCSGTGKLTVWAESEEEFLEATCPACKGEGHTGIKREREWHVHMANVTGVEVAIGASRTWSDFEPFKPTYEVMYRLEKGARNSDNREVANIFRENALFLTYSDAMRDAERREAEYKAREAKGETVWT